MGFFNIYIKFVVSYGFMLLVFVSVFVSVSLFQISK